MANYNALMLPAGKYTGIDILIGMDHPDTLNTVTVSDHVKSEQNSAQKELCGCKNRRGVSSQHGNSSPNQRTSDSAIY